MPLKIGDIFQTPRPPILCHCPSESSIKYIGIPANTLVRKYGIRNAPVTEKQKE